ncbi:MAG TPA: type III pantothenate kinase, partial [Candidatus Eisenbacteria bacterium]
GRRYRGGVIVPGVVTGAEQLIRRAARLGAFELKPPARVVGRTTEESLQSGVFHGAVGQVDSIVGLISREERIRPTVIATGGLAAAIAPYSRTIDHVDPDLTLHGLLALHARHLARALARAGKPKGKKR